MKRARSINRLTVCWSVFNGSKCLCSECWGCKRKMQYLTKKIAEEKAKKASDELLAEMMTFQDRFANSKNAAVAFFGRVIGGTRSDRGELDARRLDLKEEQEILKD